MHTKTENWIKLKINRWIKTCAASKVITSTREGIITMQAKTGRAQLSGFYVAAAFLMGLMLAGAVRGQALIPPWLPGPAPVSCAPFTFSPVTGFGTMPSPIFAGESYKLVVRGALVVDQYYFEAIPGGSRLRIRSTETGNPFSSQCFVLDVPFTAPTATNAGLEVYGYLRNAPNSWSAIPGVGLFNLPVVHPTQPVPAFSMLGLVALIAAFVYLARRKLVALSAVLLCHLIAPPLWRFHIGG